jgi:hypothetical protein
MIVVALARGGREPRWEREEEIFRLLRTMVMIACQLLTGPQGSRDVQLGTQKRLIRTIGGMDISSWYSEPHAQPQSAECDEEAAWPNKLNGNSIRHLKTFNDMPKRRREEDAEPKPPKKKTQKDDVVPLKVLVAKPAPSAPAADIDFPRGGGSSFTPLETKAIRAEAFQELKDEQIFKVRPCPVFFGNKHGINYYLVLPGCGQAEASERSTKAGFIQISKCIEKC